MSAAEQFILTVSERGYGKRSSSYEYRITNRGGKGMVAMAIWEGKKGAETIKEKIGRLVASFPVEEADQLMLVTDGGQLIRCPVNGIRIAGRSTQGVIVFNTADDEKVVSVERIGEEGERERRELAARLCAYSPLMPAAATTLFQSASWLAIILPKVSGVSILISAPSASSRSRVAGSFKAFAERGVELVDDIGRRAGRRHHAEPERRVQLRIAHLRRGRHVRQFRAPFVGDDRERADLAGLDVRQDGGARIGDHLDFAGQNGGEHRARSRDRARTRYRCRHRA